MTQVNVTAYNKNFLGTLPFSNTSINILLAASTAISWTVPGDATQIFRACFRASSTAEIWVRLNGTAQVPTSNTVTSVPNQEFIPLCDAKYIKGGDTLSFISTGTPQVGVSLLQVQNNI
jgi:hypothetical protein